MRNKQLTEILPGSVEKIIDSLSGSVQHAVDMVIRAHDNQEGEMACHYAIRLMREEANCRRLAPVKIEAFMNALVDLDRRFLGSETMPVIDHLKYQFLTLLYFALIPWQKEEKSSFYLEEALGHAFTISLKIWIDMEKQERKNAA